MSRGWDFNDDFEDENKYGNFDVIGGNNSGFCSRSSQPRGGSIQPAGYDFGSISNLISKPPPVPAYKPLFAAPKAWTSMPMPPISNTQSVRAVDVIDYRSRVESLLAGRSHGLFKVQVIC